MARVHPVGSILAALLGAFMAPALAGPPPGDLVGADACAACHPDETAAWRRTAHAGASAPAVLGPRARSAGCLSCHATARRLGVECEACHGAGAAYAVDDIMRDRHLARLLGLRDAAASCRRCHRDRAPPSGTKVH